LPDAAKPPWTDTSAAIDVSCSAMTGAMRFRASRNQLSAAQLDLLARLAVVRSNPNICVADGVACQVAITQADGSVTSHPTVTADPGCGMTGDVIAWESFLPFSGTIPCSYAAAGTTVRADVRCFNGVSVPQAATVKLSVAVEQAGTPYHIELSHCAATDVGAAPLAMHLFEPSATIELIAGTPVAGASPDRTCAKLDYTFPYAADFPVTINAGPAFLDGVFLIRFY